MDPVSPAPMMTPCHSPNPHLSNLETSYRTAGRPPIVRFVGPEMVSSSWAWALRLATALANVPTSSRPPAMHGFSSNAVKVVQTIPIGAGAVQEGTSTKPSGQPSQPTVGADGMVAVTTTEPADVVYVPSIAGPPHVGTGSKEVVAGDALADSGARVGGTKPPGARIHVACRPSTRVSVATT